MKAQQKNWKWKVKSSLKNGVPIFLRVKVRFVLLAGSTVVTLNVEKKWVRVVFDDDVMNFILCIPCVFE